MDSHEHLRLEGGMALTKSVLIKLNEYGEYSVELIFMEYIFAFIFFSYLYAKIIKQGIRV